MSGHSKWSTIKRKKGALDAKRGKIFTKIIKEITVAAREGGSDPAGNPRLRLAIQNAKGANVPKDTIERAVNKGAGHEGAAYTELTYEGYAPGGVAIFVECATDNLNRTVAAVRAVFNKFGGSLGKNGSLEFIFDRKGIFTLPVPEKFEEEEFMLELIDAGAQDVEVKEGYITISTAMEDFGAVQRKLEAMHLEAQEAGLQRVPNTFKQVEDEVLPKVMKLIDMLEDDDDIQKVYHNLEVSDDQYEMI